MFNEKVEVFTFSYFIFASFILHEWQLLGGNKYMHSDKQNNFRKNYEGYNSLSCKEIKKACSSEQAF